MTAEPSLMLAAKTIIAILIVAIVIYAALPPEEL